jgi:hypothetical protein
MSVDPSTTPASRRRGGGPLRASLSIAVGLVASCVGWHWARTPFPFFLATVALGDTGFVVDVPRNMTVERGDGFVDVASPARHGGRISLRWGGRAEPAPPWPRGRPVPGGELHYATDASPGGGGGPESSLRGVQFVRGVAFEVSCAYPD